MQVGAVGIELTCARPDEVFAGPWVSENAGGLVTVAGACTCVLCLEMFTVGAEFTVAILVELANHGANSLHLHRPGGIQGSLGVKQQASRFLKITKACGLHNVECKSCLLVAPRYPCTVLKASKEVNFVI